MHNPDAYDGRRRYPLRSLDDEVCDKPALRLHKPISCLFDRFNAIHRRTGSWACVHPVPRWDWWPLLSHYDVRCPCIYLQGRWLLFPCSSKIAQSQEAIKVFNHPYPQARLRNSRWARTGLWSSPRWGNEEGTEYEVQTIKVDLQDSANLLRLMEFLLHAIHDALFAIHCRVFSN